jgi:putative salt-induced outer membrane protein YdiY
MTLLNALILAAASTPAVEAPQPQLSVSPTLTEEEAENLNKWTGSFNAGGTVSTGNTARKSANAALDMQRRGEKDRWTIGASWDYGQDKDLSTGTKTTTQRHLGAELQYDYFLSEKSFALANLAGQNDLLADLRLRSTIGVGYGYQFAETENWKLAAEVGAGYYKKDYYNSADVEYPNGRFAYTWEGRFGRGETKNWLVAQDFNVLPSLEDGDQVYTRLDTRLRYDMSAAWHLQLQNIWEWDNIPAPGLRRSDVRTLLSVGYSF